MTEAAKKKEHLYIHIIITVFFMFGFGYLPAPEPITVLGMKMLGVFLGLIYAWSFSTLLWPSLMGILALVTNGCLTLKAFLTVGFANDTVVFLLFIFIFTAAVEKEGVTTFIANWCISRKILTGRPWLLSFSLLVGAMVTAAFTNMFAAILIFWSIFYSICKQAGYKPSEKYPTLMVLGIAVFGILGICLLPFRTAPLITLGAYQSLTGATVDFLHFMIFVIPTLLLVLLAYLGACRFLFRVDVSALKSVKVDFIDEASLRMTKRQKAVMSFLIAFIILAVLPTILPQAFFFTQLLNAMTTTGMILLLLMIMTWVKVDGEPLISFQALASQGIIWDMMLLFIIILPLSNLLMGEDTGIKPFMVNALLPIFSNISPLVFMFVALFLPIIITNFANNIVTAMIFIQIICSIADTLNVNMTPMILTLMIGANLAFYTPAASAPAALVFGNTEWIRPRDIYTLGGVMMLLLAVVVIVFGLFWGNIIF